MCEISLTPFIKPFILSEFLNCASLSRVFLKHPQQEMPQARTNLPGLTDFDFFFVDLLDDAELCVVPERQLVEDHAVEGDTQGPDVCTLTTETVDVRIATLRGHEMIGPFCLANFIVFFLCEQLADPEVPKLSFE